jgi:hypothetical protein
MSTLYFLAVLAICLIAQVFAKCPRFICTDLSKNPITMDSPYSFCLYQSEGNIDEVWVDDKICKKELPDQTSYCSLMEMKKDPTDPSSIYTKAVCRGINEFSTSVQFARLPGEFCDEKQEIYICAFGKRECLYGRCLGYTDVSNKDCNLHEDCNPKYYCNFSAEPRRCAPYKEATDKCTFHEECGRNMLCYKDKVGASSESEGLCTAFGKLPKGTLIDVKDNNYWLQLLCIDGFADTKTTSDS